MIVIEKKIAKPVIIIGGPRTGTSVLGRIMAQHPYLVYANEPRTIWRYGNDRKSDMLVAADARPEVCKEIRNYFENFILKNKGGRLLEKTPSNALRLSFVNQIFPDCKFVNIIRNGYDTSLSIHSYWQGHTHGISFTKIDIKDSILFQRLKEIRLRQIPYYANEFLLRLLPKGSTPRVLWGPRLPGLKEMVRDLGLLSASALQWRFCVEAACQFGRKLPGDRYMEVRLEDLDWPTMRRILDFCELEKDVHVEKYFTKHFQQDKLHSRRARASEDEIREITQWIAPTMQWLGYG